MSEWKTIDSAPKDGTRILLYRREWMEDRCVGYWDWAFKDWCVAGAGAPFAGPTHWAMLSPPPEAA